MNSDQKTNNLRIRLLRWIEQQGPGYKRATMAASIGISPRHLNNFLQGKRNLSRTTEARVTSILGQISLPGDSQVPTGNLREWLKQHQLKVSDLAMQMGRPVKTVEDWVYKAKNPSMRNQALLYLITRLPQFAPRPVPPPLRLPSVSPADSPSAAKYRAKSALHTFRQLIHEIQELAEGPVEGREYFRRHVSGPDVGYLRSALAALLDEVRLEDWKHMTTYRPARGDKT